jgi:hypothetical protein
MDRHFKVRPYFDAGGQSESIERFKKTFVVSARVVWLGVIHRNAKHIPLPAEWSYVRDTKRVRPFDQSPVSVAKPTRPKGAQSLRHSWSRGCY